MHFKNISPLGDLEVVGVGLVAAGDEFEATGDLAESLLKQSESFERTDDPHKTAPAEKKPTKAKE